jgi:hypothetical protein
MAATIAGAIRELIVADGVVSARVWADAAPERATLPYVTITDAISAPPTLTGDQATIMITRQVQVDLWEKQPDEDETVARALFAVLDGAKPVIGGATVTRLSVDDSQRFVEADTHIVHRAFTLSVRHDPSAF